MRNLRASFTLVAVIMALVFTLAFAGDTPWFDMQNCEMCKPLMEQPGLIQHMTWEQHSISNGIISITTVQDQFMKPYQEAEHKMQAVGTRLKNGEAVKLCPSCTAFGQIMMKNPKIETVKTMHGDIMIVTSQDPEVVKELQNWAAHNTQEMKKMHEMEKAKKMKESKKS